jgi:molybdate transport system ATP-binding protein
MLELQIAGTTRLNDANWQIKIPKGITAIVGPSGAGKTSLLRAIAGLDGLAAGKVLLSGKTLEQKPQARNVGMVFQEPRMLNHLSVKENIALGRKSDQRVEEIATQLGIEKLLDRSPAKLSGGEQQRVMIARALFVPPKIMLLDEPLSAVDPRLKSQLLQLVRELFAQRDIPTLYVTHHMDEAAKIADQLLVMRAREIVDFGPVAETMVRLQGDEFFERGVSSLLQGEVHAVEQDFELAEVQIGGQIIEVPSADVQVGSDVRLRIWARDVLLSKERVSGLSARNQLKGTIEHVIQIDKAKSDVIVRVEGELLRARVMNKTMKELGFDVGSDVVAIFKSVSIE